ncbi:MAG: prephenate dehydratase [Lachnospiraceae bacterium]|nr:prephenate dehydratase [Lachnospiraceae bacterium]
MIDLSKSREHIDRIDKQIVNLFEERMSVAGDVAEYKRNTGKKVFDPEREAQKLETLGTLASTEFNERAIRELFSQIMSISRKYQYTLLTEQNEKFEELPELPKGADTRVCFFGAPGSYSEQAMEECFGSAVTSFPAASFKEVMEAVQNEKADFGVLPIENTTTGGITDSYDLLMEYDNYLIGEHVVKIEHALLGIPGAKPEQLRKVYSHSQGLSQCKKFFDEYPEIRPAVSSSTSESAKKVMEAKDTTLGAIASKRAAGIYGLEVLRECLNTEDVNSTRFIIVTNRKIFLPKAKKISICFELPHESGSLYKMLSHIMYNNLNMTKIESRPIPGRSFEYRFFVDFEGKITDAAVRNTLNGIREEASRLKILGNIATE